MKLVRFSPLAIDDLEGIWRFSAERWGADQADRYLDGLHDACSSLAEGRIFGREVTVRPGYLKFVIGSHAVYYLDGGAQLNIIRVLHVRQDVELNI